MKDCEMLVDAEGWSKGLQTGRTSVLAGPAAVDNPAVRAVAAVGSLVALAVDNQAVLAVAAGSPVFPFVVVAAADSLAVLAVIDRLSDLPRTT